MSRLFVSSLKKGTPPSLAAVPAAVKGRTQRHGPVERVTGRTTTETSGSSSVPTHIGDFRWKAEPLWMTSSPQRLLTEAKNQISPSPTPCVIPSDCAVSGGSAASSMRSSHASGDADAIGASAPGTASTAATRCDISGRIWPRTPRFDTSRVTGVGLARDRRHGTTSSAVGRKPLHNGCSTSGAAGVWLHDHFSHSHRPANPAQARHR